MLEVKNLSIKYKSTNRLVINNLSFKAKKGEIVAILGSSGCGKTTLLKSIQGIGQAEVVKSGQILTGNQKICTVFQESRLLPWKTVLENIRLVVSSGNKLHKQTVKDFKKELDLVGLWDFRDYPPSKLSTGMRQRVNFVRAIAAEPQILLLDEPFSALDKKTKEGLRDQFKAIIKAKKITAVFVTHDQAEARAIADKFLVLDGKSSASEVKNEK